MNKNRIAYWAGFAGGGVFLVLNIATQGQVPGGFQGGVLGFILFYPLAWMVLAFMPPDVFQAVKKANAVRVRELISRNVDLNQFDDANLTPLAYASSAGISDIVELLLEGGADPNALRKTGTTPLMNAAVQGHAKTVDLLLDGGADMLVKDVGGKLAADWAADGGHTQLAARLRPPGATGGPSRTSAVSGDVP